MGIARHEILESGSMRAEDMRLTWSELTERQPRSSRHMGNTHTHTHTHTQESKKEKSQRPPDDAVVQPWRQPITDWPLPWLVGPLNAPVGGCVCGSHCSISVKGVPQLLAQNQRRSSAQVPTDGSSKSAGLHAIRKMRITRPSQPTGALISTEY